MWLPRARKVAVFIFVTAFLLTSSTMAEMAKFGKISDEDWAVLAPEDYPEADAIILVDQAKMEVSLQSIRYNRLVRIKILTKAGIKEVGDQSFGYWKGSDKIKKFKAHTITPDGKKHKIGKKAVHTKASGNYRTRTFAFPKLEVGAIVEYEYTNVSKRYQYLAPWYFQNSLYTKLSSFAVTFDNGFTYAFASHRLSDDERRPMIDSVIDVEGQGRDSWHKTYSWQMENIPPVTPEPYMGAVNLYRSSMKFQLREYKDQYFRQDFTNSWSKLGEDAQYLLDEYTNRKGDIRQLAEKITPGATTDMEKSQLLYNYVINNFQTSYDYTDFLFANSKMGELLNNGYGSPEGKNLLLIEMHRQLGLTAYPILIATRSFGRIWKESPDLRQFDYLISYIQLGDSYVLLDATTKLRPYGLMPPECLVDIGFQVDGQRSRLIGLSQVPLNSSRTDYTRVFLDENGMAACSTISRMQGYMGAKLAQSAEKYTSEEFVRKRFLDKLDIDYELEDHKTYLDGAGQFVLEINFSSSDLTSQLDANLVIQQTTMAFKSNPFYKPKRFFPVDFQYPFTYTNIMEIHPPPGVTEFELPIDLDIKFLANSFVRQSEHRDSVVYVIQTLTIENPTISPRNYSGLREFFGSVVMACEDPVIAVFQP